MKFKKSIFLIVIIISVGFLSYKNMTFIKDTFIRSPLAKAYIYFRDGKKVDQDHVITTLDDGTPIIVNIHDRCVCWFTRLMGYWDNIETKALGRIIKPNFTIIEVGSNFGVHTLRMAKLVGENGKIFAFEANPNVSKYLKETIKMNNLQNRVHVYANAVADVAYEGFMVYGLKNIGGGHIIHDNEEAAQICKISECTPIKTVVLDHLFPDEKIDMLKIDAEGAEPWIIKGAKNLIKRNPNIILMMEWAPDQWERNHLSQHEFINILIENGFKFWGLSRDNILEPLTVQQISQVVTRDIVASRQEVLLHN